MKTKSIRFVLFPAASIFLLVPGFANPARAQSQQSQDSSSSSSDSVADAARKAREQKAQAAHNATKPSKVFTDDDIDKNKVKSAQEGPQTDAPKQETEPSSPQPGAKAEGEPAAAEKSPADNSLKAADSAEIAEVKEALAQAEKDIDVAKRELALDQDSFLSKVDYQHDSAGKAKLNTEQQQIDDKQQMIETLKAKLAELIAKQSASKSDNPPQPPQQ